MERINNVDSDIYNWETNSTYFKRPPFFDNLPDKPEGFKAQMMLNTFITR